MKRNFVKEMELMPRVDLSLAQAMAVDLSPCVVPLLLKMQSCADRVLMWVTYGSAIGSVPNVHWFVPIGRALGV